MKIAVVTCFPAIWNVNVDSRHKVVGVILMLCLFTNVFAQTGTGISTLQTSHFLDLQITDATALPAGFRIKEAQPNATLAQEALLGLIKDLRDNGWLLSDIDSLNASKDTTVAWLSIGTRAKWVALGNGNVEEAILRAAGFKSRWYQQRPVRFAEVQALKEKLLVYTENHGYPFAEIKLDSVQILDDQISASLNLSKHRFIRIDSIRVLGDVALSRSYLRAYLDLQEGQAYNEAAISAISNRIRELPFLRELKPPEILFNGDVASIGLFLEEVNASAFDFLIGVLPNSEITGKLTITGEGSLELRNAFGAGEGLALDFRQLQLGTKEFEVRVDYPYLPLLPFGAQFDFELYLRDSSYLDRRTDFGLTYLFGGNDIIKGYVENKRTVILSYDTAEILQSRSLPANLDVLTNRYGLEYRIERLDYRFNPRKGYALTFGGSGGTRKILTNESVLSLNDPTEPDFEFSSLYDSLDLKTASFTLDLGIDLFQPIGRQSVIHFGISGGWIYGGQLFTNELYRLGGARSLRGFDEESIFASLYQISTLEYRFLIGQNSLFYLFGDLAYLEEKSNEKNRVDWPFGFGAGMNFETGAGIFGLSYALGRQQGNPIEFRAAKIHFGYVNRF